MLAETTVHQEDKMESEQDFSVRELQAEVSALRKELERQRKNRPAGCEQCRQTGARCDHCFVCGSTEHYRAGCKKRRSGNDRKSMMGGSC